MTPSQIKCHDKSENKLSQEENVAKNTRFKLQTINFLPANFLPLTYLKTINQYLNDHL